MRSAFRATKLVPENSITNQKKEDANPVAINNDYSRRSRISRRKLFKLATGFVLTLSPLLEACSDGGTPNPFPKTEGGAGDEHRTFDELTDEQRSQIDAMIGKLAHDLPISMEVYYSAGQTRNGNYVKGEQTFQDPSEHGLILDGPLKGAKYIGKGIKYAPKGPQPNFGLELHTFLTTDGKLLYVKGSKSSDPRIQEILKIEHDMLKISLERVSEKLGGAITAEEQAQLIKASSFRTVRGQYFNGILMGHMGESLQSYIDGMDERTYQKTISTTADYLAQSIQDQDILTNKTGRVIRDRNPNNTLLVKRIIIENGKKVERTVTMEIDFSESKLGPMAEGDWEETHRRRFGAFRRFPSLFTKLISMVNTKIDSLDKRIYQEQKPRLEHILSKHNESQRRFHEFGRSGRYNNPNGRYNHLENVLILGQMHLQDQMKKRVFTVDLNEDYLSQSAVSGLQVKEQGHYLFGEKRMAAFDVLQLTQTLKLGGYAQQISAQIRENQKENNLYSIRTVKTPIETNFEGKTVLTEVGSTEQGVELVLKTPLLGNKDGKAYDLESESDIETNLRFELDENGKIIVLDMSDPLKPKTIDKPTTVYIKKLVFGKDLYKENLGQQWQIYEAVFTPERNSNRDLVGITFSKINLVYVGDPEPMILQGEVQKT